MADDPRLPTSIRDEIATAERNWLHPLFGNRLLPHDDLLMQRGGSLGLQIYDDLYKDTHVYAVLQKRKMGVTSRPWKVDPAPDPRPIDIEAADLVRKQLSEFDFASACLGLLDAIMKGYSVGEVMWTVRDGMIAVDRIIVRDQRRFVFHKDYSLRLLDFDNFEEGIPLPDKKFVSLTFGAVDGDPYGTGLGQKLFWPVSFKRQDLAFWLVFTDKFASPTAVGEYPPGTSQVDQAKLLAAAAAFSHEAALVIPQGMVIKLIEASRAGSVDAYDKLVRYLDEQISEAVLGETMTTNVGAHGGGNKALGEIHNEIRIEAADADAGLLAGSLNKTLVPWIVQLNMPNARPPILSWDFSLPEDLQQRATRDQIVYSLGFKPTLDYVTRTYGDGWEERQVAPAPTVATETPKVAFSEHEGSGLLVEAYTEMAGAHMPQAMDPLVEPIRELMNKAKTLEELRDGLARLYPKMPEKRLAKLVANALTAGNLAGRYEAKHGA